MISRKSLYLLLEASHWLLHRMGIGINLTKAQYNQAKETAVYRSFVARLKQILFGSAPLER